MRKFIQKPRQAGFALVVTLSLMILLTVVAVGLLSLSGISLRATSQGAAQSIANNNARLALMLAIGELQASLGPDTAVSAPASAIATTSAQSRVTGAWKSWRWAPSLTGTPDYGEKAARFDRWLISSPDPTATAKVEFSSSAAPTGTNSVTLVSALQDSEDVSTAVVASKVPVRIGSQVSKFGWAAFDESTKAPINLGDSPILAASQEIASRSVPNRTRPDVLGNGLSTLKNPVNVVSMATATIPAGGTNRNEFRRRFHDLTTGSVGLLTNTATGGLKLDLTSAFEAETFPAAAFPSASPYESAFTVNIGAPRWTYLRDHYRKYKSVTNATSGEPSYTINNTTDLKISATGINPAPDTERLLPVLAKFQLVFSLVSHHALNVDDRRAFLNNSGDPKGYLNYGVAHLAYDPVITLYNPYDVTLNLSKVRVRIWDPPVGFRFSKIDNRTGTSTYFRTSNEFLGLARFQITNENNANARKCFTLALTDGTNEAAGSTLRLRPGEVKVFSPRVQDTWTWGWETDGGYSVKTFFDYSQGNNFGNQDFRTRNLPNSVGKFGVEAVPGWQSRAGLQTDHLSTAGRDASTKYPFEAARREGFVNIRLTDDVKVEAMPLVTSGTAAKQFQVDLLAGLKEGTHGLDVTTDTGNTGVNEDRLRSYSFNFSGTNPSAEISENPSQPIIERQFRAGDTLQGPDDKTSAMKKPFAMLEMSARTTKDALTDSKPWLYNNMVVEGGEQRTAQVGLAHQSYDLRLVEMSSFKGFPNGIDVDPDTHRGYFGPSDSIADGGSSFVNMYRVPVAPTASIGDLVHANLAAGANLPRVTHPLGNSRAHPLIPTNAVRRSLGVQLLDHSYLYNDALWDSAFFSTVTDYGGSAGGIVPETRSRQIVARDLFEGTKPALNSRLIALPAADAPAQRAKKIDGLSDSERTAQMAKYLGIDGPFNVNSTSVDAWRAVLSSLRDRTINGMAVKLTGTSPNVTTTLANAAYDTAGRTPFTRASKPLAGAEPPNNLLWAGFRTLDDSQITSLARSIVAEIKSRGTADRAPSLTLGEFTNRRIGSASGLHSLAGLLQTAIDKSDINKAVFSRDSKKVSSSGINTRRRTGAVTTEVLDGESAEGGPTVLTQGDLMAALGPVATVRGDTFKIRAYGEATGANGTTVTARSWCEAVVQRVPEFVDPTNSAEAATAALSPINQKFGRRFTVVSFRWLRESEL